MFSIIWPIGLLGIILSISWLLAKYETEKEFQRNIKFNNSISKLNGTYLYLKDDKPLRIDGRMLDADMLRKARSIFN